MSIVLNPTSLFQAILLLNVSVKFEQDRTKDEEAATIKYRLFSAIFNTQQSKDDVITS